MGRAAQATRESFIFASGSRFRAFSILYFFQLGMVAFLRGELIWEADKLSIAIDLWLSAYFSPPLSLLPVSISVI